MKKKIDYEIAVATLADIEGMFELLYPNYFYESGYRNQEPDFAAIKNICRQYINNIVFLAKHEGKIVGMVCACIHKTFYKCTECDVDMFFILPEYRGTGISRDLIKCLVEVCDRLGVGIIYSSSLSGIDEKNSQLFYNLWKKFGFKPLGMVMIRG